ncbi:unnamed protein product [Rhizoctonia solani]|uniref:MYND-type domain-containing protein n=1 Tax=Rhizoctonia solani TaxID=456999 RepID=A0A8H3CET7_9AGAM|nr:unnamed protein product [Rhizoctonia solani]
MSILSHPRWGRKIGSYSLTSNVNCTTLSIDSEIAGLRAMKEISGLASEPHVTAPTSSADFPAIQISTLERALYLTRDPTRIHHLVDPSVVSGCIRLMKSVISQSSGFPSPFSYELGYLCFRLLIITLNACLLDRWGRLDEALAKQHQFPHSAAHVLISIEVSSAVHKQFENLVNGGDCDWVLGFSTADNHRRPQQASLLLRSDIEALLDMLWDDRKMFLRALMLDVPIASGLSGLLFVFSRRVAQERDTQQNPSPLRRKLYELALRYYLVQDSSQIGPTLNVISSNPCYGDWINTPKHVDGEDSRSIMTAFIKRISGCNDPEHLIMEDASMMLRFVPLSIDASTQDLLPDVLKHMIEYGWLVLLAQDDKDEIRLIVHTLLPALSWLISPPHNRPYRLEPPTKDQIVDTIRKGDLLDWMAFAMYKLDPSPAAFGERSIQAMDNFFAALANTVPRSKLGSIFQDYAPEWRKFYRHLKATGSSVNIPCQKCYNACLQTWYQIAQSLGFEQALYEYELTDCFNGRCPRAYTNDADGPRFLCATCRNAVYCSDQCQSMGWNLGDSRVPHQELCGL